MRPYLQLLRPANVVTALADVLAGGAVAQFAAPRALWGLLPATACLYAGGVVLNDYFDRDLDAIERPERPIPSGAIPASRAAALGGGLLAAGIACALAVSVAAGAMAALTAAAILLYDAWAKRQTFAGPPVMGLCRALNFLIGLAAVPAVLATHWPLGGLSFVYITAVTIVSRGEVHGGRTPIGVAALISLGTVVGILSWLNAIGRSRLIGLALCALLAVRVLPPFWRAARRPVAATIRQAIRAGVLSLVLVDAALAAAFAGWAATLPILATAVAAGWLARRFAVT